MAFKPRTACPERGSKWWTQKAYGGVSPCITGSPFIQEGWTLPNCFSGDTEIITSTGIKKLKEIVNQSVSIPTIDGSWHDATIQNFGIQRLWEVQLGRNTYYASANHRWVVYSQSGKSYRIVTTENLSPGMHIRYTFYQDVEFEDDLDGIRHGFVFGDGSLGYKGKYTSALVCGEKLKFMPNYFEGCKVWEYSCGTLEYPYQIAKGKELPDISCSKTYIYNFLRGYFAADGSVDRLGNTIDFCCKDDKTLESIRSMLAVLGIRCGKVATRIESGYNGLAPMSYLSINKSCLTSKFFLNPVHRSRFESTDKKRIRFTTVKSVNPTDRYEEVFCPVEPVTHTCTLGGGELTGQCVGYAWGRFSEIMGKPMDERIAVNADQWIAKNEEIGSPYKTGMEPKLGAVGVQAAQHVWIVEEVHADGSVTTSESGWNSPEWWSQKREPPNYGSGTFLGFIYNPAVEEGAELPTLEDNKTLKEAFVSEANEHVGRDGHKWVQKMLPSLKHKPWSSATLGAISKKLGSLEIIPVEFTIYDLIKNLIEKKDAMYIKGQKDFGKDVDPEPGDIFVIQNKVDIPKVSLKGRYSGIHCGLVTSVNTSKNTILTVEGNCDGGQYRDYIRKKSRSINSIAYFVRPAWTGWVVDESGEIIKEKETVKPGVPGEDYEVVGGSNTVILNPLYTTSSTRADASIREFAYMDYSGNPKVYGPMGLSVVNYTGLLSAMSQLYYDSHQDAIVEEYGGNSGSPGGKKVEDDISKIQPEAARLIIEHLKKNRYNTAQAVGLIAVVKEISDFKTNSVDMKNPPYKFGDEYIALNRYLTALLGILGISNNDKKVSDLGTRNIIKEKLSERALNVVRADSEIGLYGFKGKSKDVLIKKLPDWRTNLTGQTDFMLTALNKFPSVVKDIRSQENTQSGAIKASRIWSRYLYGDDPRDFALVANNVKTFWKKVKVGKVDTEEDPKVKDKESPTPGGDVLPGGGDALSVDKFPAAYEAAPVCSLEDLKKTLYSKHGLSDPAFLACMGWIGGDEIAPKASGGYDHYWGYLSACTGINNCKLEGSQAYLNRMNTWGGWYTLDSLTKHMNEANDMHKKYMYLAIMYLDTRPKVANGVVIENGYNGPSIKDAIYVCPDIKWGHVLNNGSWVGPGGIFA